MKGIGEKLMNFHVMTLFPEMINQAMNTSIFGRAMEKGLISLNAVDIREYSEDKHRRVDDYPYGGGAGMVMTPGPVYRTYQAIMNSIQESSIEIRDKSHESQEEILICQKENHESQDDIQGSQEENQEVSCVNQHDSPTNSKKPRLIYLTPQGKVFNQTMAEEFAQEEELIFLCGHYEGIDERVLEMIVTDYVSIGDYVLTGGELPVMVMMDAISRLIPGVLNNDVSAEFESFQDNLLEYPQYTRPEVFLGHKVPEVLLSGHHANIEKFRREQSILRTKANRPDLYDKAMLEQKKTSN